MGYDQTKIANIRPKWPELDQNGQNKIKMARIRPNIKQKLTIKVRISQFLFSYSDHVFWSKYSLFGLY